MTNKLVVIAALAIAGCMSGPAAKSPEPLDPEPTSAAAATTKLVEQPRLTRVEPSQVCMVNNQFMGKPQIPVGVGGKTYFGCCEMCKSRLADDPNARTAVDPLTGTTVDKADAVIGRDDSGAVLYFENEANLTRYQETGG
jgi:YHS domain-containing protein